jgi:hypothetical protein
VLPLRDRCSNSPSARLVTYLRVWTQVDMEPFLFFFGRFRFCTFAPFSVWIMPSPRSPVSSSSVPWFTEDPHRFPKFDDSPRVWRTKQETKKPFVASSPGEHLTTHSASSVGRNKRTQPIDAPLVQNNENAYRSSFLQGYPVGANLAAPGSLGQA